MRGSFDAGAFALYVRRGFTLVELMIVVAIFAVMAAVAIPSLTNSRKVANETRAIGTLKSIATVQEQYKTRFGEFAPDFDYLEDAGYLDISFDAYEMMGWGATDATWFISIMPMTEADADKFFWCDQTGVIRYAEGEAAGPSSPPIE